MMKIKIMILGLIFLFLTPNLFSSDCSKIIGKWKLMYHDEYEIKYVKIITIEIVDKYGRFVGKTDDGMKVKGMFNGGVMTLLKTGYEELHSVNWVKRVWSFNVARKKGMVTIFYWDGLHSELFQWWYPIKVKKIKESK